MRDCATRDKGLRDAENCKKRLTNPRDEVKIDTLRKSTRTGYPLGSDMFAALIGFVALLKRRVWPGTAGEEHRRPADYSPMWPYFQKREDL